MIWRGLAIGVMISAPMGPVGILCIQRTLNKGRRTGFYTGVGAALSDLLYCLLTGFGLSFIEEFLERNQNIIQMAGSVLLIAFGIYLFKKNPSKDLRRPEIESNSSPQKDILAGFLFTFSNPLILFLIIGLFARFNFLMPEIRFYHYILGFVSILAGALGWWWIVTFCVNKLRSHFNVRSMWLVNRVIGGVILCFALVGIITSVIAFSQSASAESLEGVSSTSRTIQMPLYHLSNSTDTLSITMATLPAKVYSDFRLMIRATDQHASLNKKYSYKTSSKDVAKTKAPGWGLSLCGDSGASLFNVKIEPILSNKYRMEDTESEHLAMIIEIGGLSDTIYMPYSANTTLIISRRNDMWSVQNGKNKLLWSKNIECSQAFTSLSFHAPSGSDVVIHSLNICYTPTNPIMHITPWINNIDSLEDRIKRSANPMEGWYSIMDRDMDESLLRLGGNYRIAIVKNEDGYDIIYVSGARVNRRLWQAGMKKGELRSTSISDRFHLIWCDADALAMGNDLYATIVDGLLTLYFPYQSSQIRFVKE